MDIQDFYGIEATSDPNRWRMPVVKELCSGIGALFGGCGLGAGVAVLERITQRPLVWATAQFLQFVRPPSVLELEAVEIVRGHASSQARVFARADGQEIFTVLATLGKRNLPWSGEWAVMPETAPPEQCEMRPLRGDHEGTIVSQLEMRIANARDMENLDGTIGDGRSALWVKFPTSLGSSAPALSILGDWVPFGIGQALGRLTASNSLDNTLRMVETDHPTEWVLADIRIQAVTNGFGHGVVHLWAQDGTLLATASQSAICRQWDSSRFEEKS